MICSFFYFPVSLVSGSNTPTGMICGIIGMSGAGKSTLLKLVAGELAPAAGSIACSSRPYYVPQHLSAAGISAVGVLGVADKLDALRAICGGSADSSRAAPGGEGDLPHLEAVGGLTGAQQTVAVGCHGGSGSDCM